LCVVVPEWGDLGYASRPGHPVKHAYHPRAIYGQPFVGGTFEVMIQLEDHFLAFLTKLMRLVKSLKNAHGNAAIRMTGKKRP
jgi:hypothetical protein